MKLIILDRDGVINYDSEHYIKTPDEWIPIPGSLEAIGELTRKGYHLVVATNQSGVGRGYYDEATLAAIHNKMHALLAEFNGKIDKVFYCPHLPTAACDCRKPAPGLLRQISEHYACDLRKVPFVGDSMRDIRAALTVGCRPILLRSGNGLATEPLLGNLEEKVEVFDDLAAFAASCT